MTIPVNGLARRAYCEHMNQIGQNNVAHLSVEALRLAGIHTLFCLPGVQNDDFFDALVDAPDITPVVTRHEQGAAYMAMGAAQATGKPAGFCVVPGPGMLNATAGLSSAYWGNARVLALVGAVHPKLRGRQTGVLHDLRDPTAILGQLTKHAAYIDSADVAGEMWQDALNRLVSDIARPVSVEVPVNVWRKPTDAALVAPTATMPAVDAGRIEEAARILGRAERPLIMVGGGAQGASEQVKQLAEALQAPVFSRRMGLGVVPVDHPLHCWLPMARPLWAEADVVLGIGTRMEFPNLQWRQPEPPFVVEINLDPEALDLYSAGNFGIHADAAQACGMLLDALGAHNRPRADRGPEMARRRAEYQQQIAYLEPQISYLGAIRSVMPDNGVIVEDVTQVAFAAHLAYEHRTPGCYLSTGAAGTLGAGVAHGIGVAAALGGDRPQLTIIGDGGMLFTATELATAVQYSIPTNVLLFDNGGYGNVRRIQRTMYGPGRVIASNLRNPEWVAFGQSMGVHTRRAESPHDLPSALVEAFEHDGPSLVVVDIRDEPDPWPLLRSR